MPGDNLNVFPLKSTHQSPVFVKYAVQGGCNLINGCYFQNEGYCAVLSCGAVYYVVQGYSVLFGLNEFLICPFICTRNSITFGWRDFTFSQLTFMKLCPMLSLYITCSMSSSPASRITPQRKF